MHQDVLQVDYTELNDSIGSSNGLAVIGNLPYYITSQILFALADASHYDSVRSATVTMQLEVGQRLVAKPSTKAYGILSVVFQIYAEARLHFKIPPTVFYPKPKVDSALVGLNFLRAEDLRSRFSGVDPSDLRKVLTATFQQRRKCVRSSLKKILLQIHGRDSSKVAEILSAAPSQPPPEVMASAKAGDEFAASQFLPENWASRRPEEFKPAQFIELTRHIYGDGSVKGADLGRKVWRKAKHGKSDKA